MIEPESLDFEMYDNTLFSIFYTEDKVLQAIYNWIDDTELEPAIDENNGEIENG